MFFKSRQQKATEKLQAAAAFIVVFNPSVEECSLICRGHEQATSKLLEELMIQKLNALNFVAHDVYARKYAWANQDFFIKNYDKGFRMGRNDPFLPYVLIDGLERLMAIEGSGPARLKAVYLNSANTIRQDCPSIKADDLVLYISNKVEDFIGSLSNIMR